MLHGEYKNQRYSRSNGPHTKLVLLLLLLWLLLLPFCCNIFISFVVHLYSWHTQFAAHLFRLILTVHFYILRAAIPVVVVVAIAVDGFVRLMLCAATAETHRIMNYNRFYTCSQFLIHLIYHTTAILFTYCTAHIYFIYLFISIFFELTKKCVIKKLRVVLLFVVIIIISQFIQSK